MTGSGDHFDDRLLAAVREAIPPIAPPLALEARIHEAIAREAGALPDLSARRRAPRLRWPRLAPALAGAAALAAAVVVAVTSLRGGEPGVLEIQAVLKAPSGPAAASVDVRKTGIGRVITFESDSLPILPKGEYYELWFVGPGDRPGRPNRISAGTFHPDDNGHSFVTFAAAVDPPLYPTLSVTAEPGDGDPRATGPEVLRAGPR
jgi:anti-sigma-K factor RskA